MKNTMLDVHNMLVEELEKLADDEIMGDCDKAKAETDRAKAMAKVAHAIATNIATAVSVRVKSDEHYTLDGTELGKIAGVAKPQALRLERALS